MNEITYLLMVGYSAGVPRCFHARFCRRMREGPRGLTTRVHAGDDN